MNNKWSLRIKGKSFRFAFVSLLVSQAIGIPLGICVSSYLYYLSGILWICFLIALNHNSYKDGIHEVLAEHKIILENSSRFYGKPFLTCSLSVVPWTFIWAGVYVLNTYLLHLNGTLVNCNIIGFMGIGLINCLPCQYERDEECADEVYRTE